MSSTHGSAPSVNARAGKLVDDLAADAQALRCSVTTGEAGERRIDLGASVPGCLEAGRRLGEICMGGLGTVSLTSSSGVERWPLGVVVHSSNPVIACLGSQYAGWTITDESGFFALGSGPARALSRVEELYKELGYIDHHHKAALVIEGDSAPPPAVATKIAAASGVKTSDLTVLYAPTGSLAGTVQIAARVLEVSLHKAHSLHFNLDNIIDGYGVAPIAPPIPDFVKAMGRTNDAIIYGGRIQLFVRGSDAEAQKLANELPSNTCSIYGKPFAEIFSEVGGDFYKIDASLFSPAVVTVSNLDTGSSFHAGKLAPDIVDASFR
ncbi:methenyltetrahydromethanopterin cyclohydrolase [Hyphomicrobium sp.]|uniref:methenyltetrahydromethanopterin cyclohydrolase n=1 Tax=Hyphomicrobium sp. TaxID=82 RepID=UPI002E373425|nr:methenyltetrahydromethanopterin cyclohydrolase [Hyphomicrobium sp.]HEX2841107.1 methenyltetrahydromethanopterin cyclohydrolase [Hyphomicrobium sp.]